MLSSRFLFFYSYASSFYSHMLTTKTTIFFNLNQALKDMSNQMQARYQRLEHDELQEQLVSAQIDSCAWVCMSFAEYSLIVQVGAHFHPFFFTYPCPLIEHLCRDPERGDSGVRARYMEGDRDNPSCSRTHDGKNCTGRSKGEILFWPFVGTGNPAVFHFLNDIILQHQSIKKLSWNHIHLLERAYAAMRTQRRADGSVVRHTQRLQVVGQASDELGEDDMVFDDVNLSVVDVASVVPVFRGRFGDSPRDSFEDTFWSRQSSTSSSFTPAFKMSGVGLCVTSPNGMYMAVAGMHGEVLVLFKNAPSGSWGLLRTIGPRRVPKQHAEMAFSRVRTLSWSRNSMCVAALDADGTVRVWSLHPDGPMSESSEYLSLVLEVTRRQFMFHGGPFAEAGEVGFQTNAVSFVPQFSPTGLQPHVAVGLSNGDIIKCDTLPAITRASLMPPVVQAPPNMHSVIGKEIPAELFRGHKAAVVFVGWVGNTWPMFSVDVEGHLFLWDYTAELHTGFGWFMPLKKYRLNLSERQYQPALGLHCRAPHGVWVVYAAEKVPAELERAAVSAGVQRWR